MFAVEDSPAFSSFFAQGSPLNALERKRCHEALLPVCTDVGALGLPATWSLSLHYGRTSRILLPVLLITGNRYLCIAVELRVLFVAAHFALVRRGQLGRLFRTALIGISLCVGFFFFVSRFVLLC